MKEVSLRIINKGFIYSQDGPGNRLVYHLGGCNMKCPWCANPEGMNPEGIYLTEKNGTRHLSYKIVKVEDMIEEICSAIPVMIDGGGVTFSGGEPTLQFEGLIYILEQLQKKGIHTAIETNGSSPRLKELIPLLNLLIIDFKHPFSEVHKKYTGVGNEIIEKNIREISDMGVPMWIRTPLINGVNTSSKCMEKFIQIYTGGMNLSNVSFELLYYHELGAQKWEKCGLEYKMEHAFVTKCIMRMWEDAYKNAGLKLIHT